MSTVGHLGKLWTKLWEIGICPTVLVPDHGTTMVSIGEVVSFVPWVGLMITDAPLNYTNQERYVRQGLLGSPSQTCLVKLSPVVFYANTTLTRPSLNTRAAVLTSNGMLHAFF